MFLSMNWIGDFVDLSGLDKKSLIRNFTLSTAEVEDIYVKEEFRGMGIGSGFLKYIECKYPDALLRLEVEEENERALSVYKKCGFDVLPYMEMKK